MIYAARVSYGAASDAHRPPPPRKALLLLRALLQGQTDGRTDGHGTIL